MTKFIKTVLEAEKRTLEELHAISVKVTKLDEADTELLSGILGRRSELMLNLSELEESRLSFFSSGGELESGEPLPGEVKRLARSLDEAEGEAAANLSRLLGCLKKEAAGFEKGVLLVQGYGIVPDHLSRFADKVG